MLFFGKTKSKGPRTDESGPGSEDVDRRGLELEARESEQRLSSQIMAETGAMDALDRAAMERLLRGEEDALRELAERYGARVVTFLHRLVGNPHDAVDLCQETFLRVYRYREEYDQQRSFRIWLFTIAANLGRNVLRARRRFLRVSLEDETRGPSTPRVLDILAAEDPQPDESVERSELHEAVRGALKRLSPDLRSAVQLVDLEDYSTLEAAKALQIPPRTVESRLYHGRRRLRQVLARWLSRVALPMGVVPPA
jgi:RNA polymerase sigma-70 factor (ECF subfamily)